MTTISYSRQANNNRLSINETKCVCVFMMPARIIVEMCRFNLIFNWVKFCQFHQTTHASAFKGVCSQTTAPDGGVPAYDL